MIGPVLRIHNMKCDRGFQVSYLHLTLHYFKDQGQVYQHFYCAYLRDGDVGQILMLSPYMGIPLTYLQSNLVRSKALKVIRR